MNSSRTKRRYTQTARARSAEATGRCIIDAFLRQLMEQWYDEITLDLVAEEAGVSVQTVIRRFGGKEGLLDTAVEILATQINAQRAAPAGDIDESLDRLVADYERTGDAVIRLLALETRQPAVHRALELGRREHRQWASRAFAEPLHDLAGASRTQALDALVVATDVYTWKVLRRDLQRTAAATATTMKTLIQAVLAEFSIPHQSGERQ